VAVDPKYFRPTEVDLLIGDPSQWMQKLNWQSKDNLQSLVKEMVWNDVRLMATSKQLATPIEMY
jgi:GDPmannose 4,6-dehydratase